MTDVAEPEDWVEFDGMEPGNPPGENLGQGWELTNGVLQSAANYLELDE